MGHQGGQALPGHVIDSPPRDRVHPTEKPVAVMRTMVRIAPAGGLVLDPFAGSGTTGVACAYEGRRFLGVELDERHAETARTRIAGALRAASARAIGA